MHKLLATQTRNALVRPGPDDQYADGDDASWQGIDWPPMLRSVDTRTGPVNVLDTGGDGSALVWIHGLNGVWQNWLLNIPAFMDEHRCVAMDLPGFGHSPMPEDGEVSITRYAEVVADVCAALEIERVTVVGNSMGGFIGAELTLRFRELVEQLVLVSAAGLAIEHQRRQPLLFAARVAEMGGLNMLARMRMIATRPRARRVALQTIMRYPERVSAALVSQQVQPSRGGGFAPALDALTSYSFRDRLREIEVPVLVVWGENDMLVPTTDAQRFVDLIGDNARKEIFEDTGHVPMLERPSRFNALLGEFLAGDREPEADVTGVHS